MHHTLLETLGIQPGETVALVGAGGKTTTLQRLVAEIRAQGRTVLTTSTVHLFELKGSAPHAFVVEPDPARLRAELPGLLAEWGHVRVAGDRLRADKIRGLTPDAVAALRGTPGLDYLLVEADGARHRSLKAPAAHEPVLPPGVDRVLIVVGLDILGQSLSEATVHRPAEVAALTGLAEGDPITVAAVAAVLTSPHGGLKDVPPPAAVWVVATKLTPARRGPAGELAAALLLDERISGVVLLGPAPVAGLPHVPLVVLRAQAPGDRG
jgi:molybdenum cofactor cytidylyltransferase